MSLLGRYTEKTNRGYRKYSKQDDYKMPAVTREIHDGSISLKKGITISAIIHPSAAVLLWLIVTILALFGITFSLFEKPKPKVNDIEFVLVDKEETPVNKNTPYRADKNSRTGGINNPKLPVSMPSAPAA